LNFSCKDNWALKEAAEWRKLQAESIALYEECFRLQDKHKVDTGHT
jgi:hypothetical protein